MAGYDPRSEFLSQFQARLNTGIGIIGIINGQIDGIKHQINLFLKNADRQKYRRYSTGIFKKKLLLNISSRPLSKGRLAYLASFREKF
jgi:hypothetical protein